MTRDEMKKVVAVIVAAYPNFNPPDMKLFINTWTAMLGSYTVSEVGVAVEEYIMTDSSGFAPSIGQINGIITKHRHPETEGMTEQEAWAIVAKAIERSGYYAGEEYEKLPDDLKRAVGSPGNLHEWSQMPSDQVHTVIRSHFGRTYRTIKEREKEDAKIPENLRNRIALAVEEGRRTAIEGAV